MRMWNVKAKVVPVITGATETISKSPRKYLSNIKESMKLWTTKYSHSGHGTRTMESANVKVQNILLGLSNTTCRTNCKCTTAATPCTLETCFVSGI